MPQNFEKPVGGYNHNVKHRGKIFHVQTEDSGVKNPHIITHLFVGGNIIASKKISYADILNAENLSEAVRQLMEMQHKEILRNLVNGTYDDLDSVSAVPHYQPGEIAPAALRPLVPPLTPIRRSSQPPARSPPVLRPLLPEVLAARDIKVPPKLSESPVETLFGEDLISEKSLDEVILSYLADDPDQ